MLCDEQSEAGGWLLSSDEKVDGVPAAQWVEQALKELASLPEVRVLPRTTAFGYHDHNLVTLIERRGDHLPEADAPVFRERLWKQDLQLVWIRWFMDYPDPHNEYFDTFYSNKPTGKRQAWSNEHFDKVLEAGRDTRDSKKRLEHYLKAEELLQSDVGYVPVAWVVRYGAAKPYVRGLEKNKAGEPVLEGNIYVDMLSHLYIVEKA